MNWSASPHRPSGRGRGGAESLRDSRTKPPARGSVTSLGEPRRTQTRSQPRSASGDATSVHPVPSPPGERLAGPMVPSNPSRFRGPHDARSLRRAPVGGHGIERQVARERFAPCRRAWGVTDVVRRARRRGCPRACRALHTRPGSPGSITLALVDGSPSGVRSRARQSGKPKRAAEAASPATGVQAKDSPADQGLEVAPFPWNGERRGGTRAKAGGCVGR